MMENIEVRLPLRVLADVGGWQLSKWLVKVGDKVYRNQRVAVFKSTSSGAVEHALAPRAGTLHMRHVHEGVVVEVSNAHIAEILYCPHSVVFKGVCAVCGEEAEQAHFAETATQLESRLPVAYNATSLSVTRAEAISVSSSTAQRLFDSKRLSLVLDLDHTLVHATDDPRAAAVLHHSPENVDLSSVSSFALGPHPDTGPAAMMYLKLRPNLSEFLARVAAKFELHIYTMGSRPYADRVAQLIDPGKHLFSGRITSREDFAEGRCNQKSIERLFPCDDSMVLIVDDREDVWISGTGQAFMPNLIRAHPYCFWDGLHEAYDRSSPTSEPGSMAATTRSSQTASLRSEQKVKNKPITTSRSDGPDEQKAAERSSALPSTQHSSNEIQTPEKQRCTDQEGAERRKNSSEEALNLLAKPSEHSHLNGSANGAQGDNSTNGARHSTDDNQRNISSTEEKGETPKGIGERDRAMSSNDKGEAKEPGKSVVVTNVKKPKPVARAVAVPAQPVVPADELRKIAKKRWDADLTSKTRSHLLRLAEVLEECHSEFFRRVRSGSTKRRLEDLDARSGFRSPVDVKEVLGDMRRKVLSGCVITFTGVIPTGSNPEKNQAWNLALRLGATCCMDFVNGRTTHVVAAEHRAANTMKVKEAVQRGTAYVVNLQWLEDSALNFQRQDELQYCERAKQRFTASVDFRQFVETQHAEAARALRKRSVAELNDISAREVTLPVKRKKMDDHLPRKDSSNGALDTAHAEPGMHVLSGDEIGAAMDAVFDD